MKVKQLFALTALFVLCTMQAFGQNPPPNPSIDQGWNLSVSGNFTTANGATNNGVALSEGFRVSPHYVIRADQYIMQSPNVTVALGGLEYRLPGTSIFKSSAGSSYAINASKIEFFGNFEMGDAHATVAPSAPITLRHFAVGLGGGFDLCVSPSVCVRPLDLKYVNGGVLTNGGKVLGNGIQFAGGLLIRF